MQSTYYVEPGRTLKNSKVSERKLMLIAPRSEYKRFVNYTTETERMAAKVAKEEAKRAALEKATHEMSKDWDNTVENIRKRREEELLGRRKQEENIRREFAKDMAKQNAAARAEIGNEARRLLLYRRPECRLINGALLTSECFRERNAQIAFQETLRRLDDEKEREYVEELRRDAENYADLEHQKTIDQWEKNRSYGIDLKKQIAQNNNTAKRMEEEKLAQEREELRNIERELRLGKELEEEQLLNRKKELKQLVVDAIEEKKAHEFEAKLEEEFGERANQIFERSKQRIKQIEKEKVREELEKKRRHAEFIGKKCAAAVRSRSAAEEASIMEAQREKDAEEVARKEARKKFEENVRAEYAACRRRLESEKRRKKYELQEMIKWETMQRVKRDEFNKEFETNERKREREKKMATAREYEKQMAENQKERDRQKKFEEQSFDEMIEKTNKKILDYGQEVLEESRGVRPLFPIVKVIEKYKSENGLTPPKVFEKMKPSAIRQRTRKRRPTYLAPVSEQGIFCV